MKLLPLVENIDFSDETIMRWLIENGPENIFDEDGEVDWEYRDPITGDDLETLILSYKEKYFEVIEQPKVEIYRMVMLDSIKDLDKNQVGLFWSFRKNGVGAYGLGKKISGNKPYILTAIVNTRNIDWEQGFYSFLCYGTSEFECYMKKGSTCLITQVNDENLTQPIRGRC